MRKYSEYLGFAKVIRAIGAVGVGIAFFIMVGVVGGDADFSYAAKVAVPFNTKLFVISIIVAIVSAVVLYISCKMELWCKAEMKRISYIRSRRKQND